MADKNDVLNETRAYTIYELATGRIIQFGVSNAVEAMKIPVGCEMHMGESLSPDSHYFLDGRPVQYTEDEKERLRDRKDGGHIWNLKKKDWIDVRTPEEKALIVKRLRHAQYPTHEELCEALFAVMNGGEIGKVEPFFSKMKNLTEV